mgnify:CR=1 FL=1
MDKQLIISVGREFGSGGHVIAEDLAKRFDLPLYDNNLLEYVAGEKQVDQQRLVKYDEKPKNKFLHRTVRGYSSPPQENVAHMQFDYLKNLASKGESFVIVGRCSETMLKEFPALVSVFILGDKQCKIERVKEKYHLSETDANQMMQREDWQRKSYHNYYCKGKWGDSRNYDISINSSRLGLKKTADILEGYIKERMA